MKYHKDMTQPTVPGSLFVFGSNLAGQHGGGSALAALKYYGAEMGVYYGETGTAFAIPTVDTVIQPLPLEIIEMYVDKTIRYASANQRSMFMTRIGCGIAGFADAEIAELFWQRLGSDRFCVDWHNLFDFPEEWQPTFEQ